jgi:VWFA-related protein
MSAPEVSIRRLVVTSVGALAVVTFVAGALATGMLVRPLSADQAARQGQRPPAGARLLVVAYRDSGLLTLCPATGKDVIADAQQVFKGATPGAKAWVSVSPLSEFQTVRVMDPAWLRTTGAGQGWAMLPRPATRARATDPPGGFTGVSVPQAGGSIPATEPGAELDRLALDPDVKSRVESEFRKIKRFAVVETADVADYVFVVETNYLSVAAWSASGGSMSAAGLGGDRKLNFRQSALAVVVPAETYRRFPSDGFGLSANRIWEGFSLQESVRGQQSMEMREGRAEVLAAEFASKWREPIAALPICAASPGPLRVASTSVTAASGAPSDAADTAAALAQASRQEGAVFRSGVTVVRVPLTVADDNGRAIVDIKPSELHVFEQGVEQRIDTILPASASASLALLLDLSESMRQYRQDVRFAGLTLSEQMRPGDRLLMASFEARIRVLAEFTRDAGLLKRASLADPVRGLGGTRLYDAIDLVAEDRLRDVDGRAAMIVVTDGLDTHSRIVNAAGARDVIDDGNVAVYVVRYDTSETVGQLPFQLRVGPPANQRQPAAAPQGGRWLVVPDELTNGSAIVAEADQFLSRLSTRSGGRMYDAPVGTDLREVFASIIEELSRQFTICYYPANAKADGTYRQINVTIDRPGHTVRSRKGYRAGGR